MRKFFDLQKPEFSDGSQEDIHMPSKQLLNMYNQEYSLLLFETKSFFAQCKDCISRLMALNNIGFGFNLPFIFTTFLAMENRAIFPNKSRQQLQSQEKKQKYFKGFYDVLYRMSGVIEDLQNIEFEIKTNYMGLNTQKSVNRQTKKKIQHSKESNSSNQSNKQVQLKNIKQRIIQEEEITNIQKQKQIRDLLRKNMTHELEGSPTNIVTFQISAKENLEKLNEKIEMMRKKMKDQREKQQKAWENFKSKLGSAKLGKIGRINEKRKSFILNDQKDEQWEDESFNTENSMRKDSSTFCF